MDNVIDQLSSVAGLDADNPHIFANIDNMGLIAGTFDSGKLRQIIDARLKIPSLKQTTLTPSSIIKALELQLLNTSYSSIFQKGQSLLHSRDYFYFTPFINLLDDLSCDYAELTPQNISKVLNEIANSDPSYLLCACAASIAMGIEMPVEAVYLDRMICGVPADKVGKAAAALAAKDAMMTRMAEDSDIDEQSFAPDRNWDVDDSSQRPVTKRFGVSSIYSPTSAYLEQQTKQALAEEKRAQQMGQGASFTLPTEQNNDDDSVIPANVPYVGLVMDYKTWQDSIDPMLPSNQLLLCECTSRVPLWSQQLPSGVDKNSPQALAMVDWHLMRLHFKHLRYVIGGASACTSENFELLSKERFFLITHLPEKHPLFSKLLEHYVSGKSLQPLTPRKSYGTGYTSFAPDQHYQEHNHQQQQNLINLKEHRKHRLLMQQKQCKEQLLGTMLPECSFEGRRVKPLLIYNVGHQEARRKFYLKVALAEKAKYQFKATNLKTMFYSSLEQAHKAIDEVNASLRLCSVQNVEFRGSLQGIRLELVLDLDQQKIARCIKHDCSMVIITNDTSRGWDADELWLMYQRMRSQRHAPELTLQHILPVDPFYLSTKSCHQGLMFLLNLGLLLHRSTEFQMRRAMMREGIALPPFKGSLGRDPRPSLFKLNNYLKEVGPSPAVEYHMHSNRVTFTKLPPFFMEILEAMGEEWAKYYVAEAYHPHDFKGEQRL